jgi:phosphoglycerate dehydrogenase-like enzyme
LLLRLTRGISINHKPHFYKHEWKPVDTRKSDDQIELAEMRMGILGMGGIGNAIARRVENGSDMHVIATDAKPIPKLEYVNELHDPSYFPAMAK